ncbi:MAG TPA: hypothetical protein VGN23_06755 [Verrucomicrobiae bacterium]|jgi:hypothetical protein
MDKLRVEKKKSQLLEQIAKTKEILKVLEGQYSVLVELDSNDSTQRVTLVGEAQRAMETLGDFTKKQLDKWIRDSNPSLEFNIKSLDRSISEGISDGKIKVLKVNIGNKMPTVYQWTGAKPMTIAV